MLSSPNGATWGAAYVYQISAFEPLAQLSIASLGYTLRGLFDSDCSYVEPWARAQRRSNQNRNIYGGCRAIALLVNMLHFKCTKSLDLKLNRKVV